MGLDVSLNSPLINIRNWGYNYPDDYNTARWCTTQEAEIIRALASHYDYYIEIGTANGFSAVAAAQSGVDVHTFDIVDRPKIWDKLTVDFDNITYYNCENLEDLVENTISKLVGNRLIFIDGDHTQDAVKRDFLLADKLKVEGILFHDYSESSVRHAINKNVNENNYVKFKLSTDRGMVYVRRKNVFNEKN